MKVSIICIFILCSNMQNLTGRILNRFSKDQALVDETLPITAQVRVRFFGGFIDLLMEQTSITEEIYMFYWLIAANA